MEEGEELWEEASLMFFFFFLAESTNKNSDLGYPGVDFWILDQKDREMMVTLWCNSINPVTYI